MDKPNISEEIAPKIKEFLTKQIEAKVKPGVDFVEIMRKLKERRKDKTNSKR